MAEAPILCKPCVITVALQDGGDPWDDQLFRSQCVNLGRKVRAVRFNRKSPGRTRGTA